MGYGRTDRWFEPRYRLYFLEFHTGHYTKNLPIFEKNSHTILINLAKQQVKGLNLSVSQVSIYILYQNLPTFEMNKKILWHPPTPSYVSPANFPISQNLPTLRFPYDVIAWHSMSFILGSSFLRKAKLCTQSHQRKVFAIPEVTFHTTQNPNKKLQNLLTTKVRNCTKIVFGTNCWTFLSYSKVLIQALEPLVDIEQLPSSTISDL